MTWRVIPNVCPRCGMPDLRSVTRYEGPEDRRVYYVDVRCVDCDWQDIDLIGGV